MAFMQGLNEDALPIVAPAMQAHLAEHYALKYYREMAQQIFDATGEMIPPPTFMDGNEDEEDMPDEISNMIAQVAAQMPPIQLMPPTEDGPDAEQQAFEAEEQRKEVAFQTEQDRVARAFEADQERKDRAVDYEADRKLALAVTDEERKEIEHSQRLRQQAREARLKNDKGSTK
jgi:hypothetical protein